jgi:flagellar hook-associated protein 2
MAGSLSTLGLGSQGVLTNDILDQLKEADTSSIIKPIERKIEVTNTKQTVLSDIKKLITDLNDQVVALNEPSLYNTKSSSLSGSSVKIDTSSSAIEQSFDINVKSLATRDIQESTQSFGYADALVGEQTLTINIDGKNYEVDVSITDSIKTLSEKIEEQTDGKVQASVLNVGGDDPYRLIFKSKETGADNAITVTSSEEDGLSFGRVGDAPKDAEVEVDGITITRSSNSIDDIVDGVTINLQTEGKTSVKIENDNEKLTEEMEKFATAYNEVIDKLTAVTKYDSENKTAGVFQGSSEIRTINATLQNVLSTMTSGSGKTVADFGLDIERGGKLKFDKDDFKEMLKEDSGKVEDFLRGTDGTNGLFNIFESKIFDLSTSSSGSMKILKSNLETSSKSLLEEQTKAQTRLDDKYKIMQKKFAAYDGVIGKLTNEANTLQSIIDADQNKK